MSRIFLMLILFSFLSMNAIASAGQVKAIDVSTALTTYYPQIKYQQITATPVAGVYEVVVETGDVVYFAPVSGHMFFGELWTADARNLTRESKGKRMSSKVDMFPLELAIKIGDGPNKVIEVTDPDCPYCRQASDFFSGREDTTRYVFLFPLDKLHPQAAAKASYVLSAKDQELAYEEVFSGKYDTMSLPEFVDNGLLEQHRQIAKSLGINGTPQFWVNGQHMVGFKPENFEKLLNK